jgi:hypothetical protein
MTCLHIVNLFVLFVAISQSIEPKIVRPDARREIEFCSAG